MSEPISKFIILVGPSGVGKSIVTRRINDILQDSPPKSLNSYTLRPPREDEEKGKTHYHFYNPETQNFDGNFFWSNYKVWRSEEQEDNDDDPIVIYKHLALDALVKKIFNDDQKNWAKIKSEITKEAKKLIKNFDYTKNNIFINFSNIDGFINYCNNIFDVDKNKNAETLKQKIQLIKAVNLEINTDVVLEYSTLADDIKAKKTPKSDQNYICEVNVEGYQNIKGVMEEIKTHDIRSIFILPWIDDPNNVECNLVYKQHVDSLKKATQKDIDKMVKYCKNSVWGREDEDTEIEKAEATAIERAEMNKGEIPRILDIIKRDNDNKNLIVLNNYDYENALCNYANIGKVRAKKKEEKEKDSTIDLPEVCDNFLNNKERVVCGVDNVNGYNEYLNKLIETYIDSGDILYKTASSSGGRRRRKSRRKSKTRRRKTKKKSKKRRRKTKKKRKRRKSKKRR